MSDAAPNDPPLPPLANIYEMLSRSTSPAVTSLFEETGFGFPTTKPGSAASTLFGDQSRPASRLDKIGRNRDPSNRRARTPDLGKDRLPEVRSRDIKSPDQNRLVSSSSSTFSKPLPMVEKKGLPSSCTSSPMRDKEKTNPDLFDSLGRQSISLSAAVRHDFEDLFENELIERKKGTKKGDMDIPRVGDLLGSNNPLEDLRKLNKDAGAVQSKDQSPTTSPRGFSIPTKIPKAFQLYEYSPILPPDSNPNAEFEAVKKLWKIPIFPTSTPITRQDVIILEKWMDAMIDKVISKTEDINVVAQETHLLYTICLHEIVRQVSIQCIERGQLIGKIWNRYCLLFEMYLNHGGDVRKALEKERDERNVELEAAKKKIKQLEKLLVEKEEELERAREAQDIIRDQLFDLQESFQVDDIDFGDMNSNFDSLSNSEEEELDEQDSNPEENVEDDAATDAGRDSDLSEEGYLELLEAQEHMKRELGMTASKMRAKDTVHPVVDSGPLDIPPLFILDDEPHSKGLGPGITLTMFGANPELNGSMGNITVKGDGSTTMKVPNDGVNLQRRNSYQRLLGELKNAGLEDEYEALMNGDKSPTFKSTSSRNPMMRSRDKLGPDSDDSLGSKSFRQRSKGSASARRGLESLGSSKKLEVQTNDEKEELLRSGRLTMSGKISGALTPSELSAMAAASKGDETKKSLQGKLHTSPPRPKTFQPGDLHPDVLDIVGQLVPYLPGLFITEKEVLDFLKSKKMKMVPAGILSRANSFIGENSTTASSDSESEESEAEKKAKAKQKAKKLLTKAKQISTSMKFTKALLSGVNSKSDAPPEPPKPATRTPPRNHTKRSSIVAIPRKSSIVAADLSKKYETAGKAKSVHRMSVCQPPQLLGSSKDTGDTNESNTSKAPATIHESFDEPTESNNRTDLGMGIGPSGQPNGDENATLPDFTDTSQLPPQPPSSPLDTKLAPIETREVGIQVDAFLDEELVAQVTIEEFSHEQKQLETEILRLRKELKRVSGLYSELRDKTHKIAAQVKEKLVIPVGIFSVKKELVSKARPGMDPLYHRTGLPTKKEVELDETKLGLPFVMTEKIYLSMRQKLPLNIDQIVTKITTNDFIGFAHHIRVKPVHYVLKRILSVLSEKVGIPQDYLYDPLNVFTYQYYITRYGLKTITERHLTDLCFNIRDHRHAHNRIYRFGQFMGLYDPLPDSCYFFYISMFKVLFEYHKVWFEFPNGSVMLSLSYIFKAAAKIFWDKPAELLMKMQIIVENISVDGKQSGESDRLVDIDLFVEVMFQQYMGLDVTAPAHQIKQLSESAELVKVIHEELKPAEPAVESRADKRGGLGRRQPNTTDEPGRPTNLLVSSQLSSKSLLGPMAHSVFPTIGLDRSGFHLDDGGVSRALMSKSDFSSNRDPVNPLVRTSNGFVNRPLPPDNENKHMSFGRGGVNSNAPGQKYGSFWKSSTMSYSAMLKSLGDSSGARDASEPFLTNSRIVSRSDNK